MSDAAKGCPNNGLFRGPVQNPVSDAAKGCPNNRLFRGSVQNPVSDAAKRCPHDGLFRRPVQNINFVRVSLRFRVQHGPVVLTP